MCSPGKICSNCGIEKSLDDFGNDKSKKDGKRGYCKECDRRLAKERAERAKRAPKIYVEEKLCRRCNVIKPRKEFAKYSRTKDGLYPYCKECSSIRCKEARKKFKDHEVIIESKVCPVCKEDKSVEEFYREPKRGDGLSSCCKVCRRAQVKKWAEANPERKRETDRINSRRKVADGRSREYYHRVKDDPEYKRKQREWRQNNKQWLRDYEREYQRIYRANNPEKRREIVRRSDHKRRAREKNLPFDITKKDIEDIFEEFGNRCAFCGSEEKLELEHVVPLSRDDVENPGTVPGNLMPLCRSCNSSKKDKMLEEYLLEPTNVLPKITALLEASGRDVEWLVSRIYYKLDRTIRMTRGQIGMI